MDTNNNLCEQTHQEQTEDSTCGLPEHNKNLKRKAQYAPDTTQAKVSTGDQPLPLFAKTFLQNSNDKWQGLVDTTALTQGTIPTPDFIGGDMQPEGSFSNRP